MTTISCRCLKAAIVGGLLVAVTGCGGGGGGGSAPTTAAVTGVLHDGASGSPLTGYTVEVHGTSLAATTNSAGGFTVMSVPFGSQVLVFVDSGGVSHGTFTTTVTASGDNVGTINIEGAPPPPAPLVSISSAGTSRQGVRHAG